MATKTQRINVSFPSDILDELRKLVPPGERSQLIVEATAKELKRRKLLQALKEAAGAWTDENHPELKTIDDIHRWLEEMRRPTEKRLLERGSWKIHPPVP